MLQRTPEWEAARVGKIGSSDVADVTARTKTGWSSSRANCMADKLCERLTGTMTKGYTSIAMQEGIEREPEARANYAFYAGVEVVEVGFIDHPRIANCGCSPDGLVLSDGILEIKCPTPAVHIETLLGAPVDGRYNKQMQWIMGVTDRQWADYVSYCPLLPEPMRLFVKRVKRDEKLINELESEVSEFLAELDAKVAALTKKYMQQEAA